MPHTEMRIIKIDETAKDRRLDQWLAEQCAPALSRSRVAKLIRDGQVSVGGKVVAEPRFKPPVGQELRLHLPPAEEAKPKGEAIKLEVLYEDRDILALNKQAGLVVHPGNGNPCGTLVNALIHYCAENGAEKGGLSGIGGVKRPGIVHRLDKDTGGVMIVAKHDEAHLALSRQFADHGRSGVLERRYQALVWGEPVPAVGKVNAPLGRAAGDRTRRAVVRAEAAGARSAVTHYKVLRRFLAEKNGAAQMSLLECRLETGRTHQIRVHMAHIGHPLLGDKTYGQAFKSKAVKLPAALREKAQAFPRQALHAVYLKIAHPKTGEIMEFSSPLPQDMQEIIRLLAENTP